LWLFANIENKISEYEKEEEEEEAVFNKASLI